MTPLTSLMTVRRSSTICAKTAILCTVHREGCIPSIKEVQNQKAVWARWDHKEAAQDLFSRALTSPLLPFLSVILSHIPNLWKTSIILLVPKKSRPSKPNHYRPVAFTSIAAKCLEELTLNAIRSIVKSHLGPYQFAYMTNRGTEDTVACLLHTPLPHLAHAVHYARVSFIDFSLAFKTIQRYLVIHTLTSRSHLPSSTSF